MVKNPPANAGDMGSIPVMKITRATGQLSPCAMTTEVCVPRDHALQQEKPPQEATHHNEDLAQPK